MSKSDQSNLPLGPNGEIPVRRDEETGEVVYLDPARLTLTPAEAADAIGALEAAKARLEYAMRHGPSRRPPSQEGQETAETDPDGANESATEDRDPEQLLTAKEVGEILGIPTKSVYELGGLERVQVGKRRVRWTLEDVREFIERRRERY